MNEGMLAALRPFKKFAAADAASAASVLFVRVLGSEEGGGGVTVEGPRGGKRWWRWWRCVIARPRGACPTPLPCNLLTQVIIHRSRLNDGSLPR